VLNLPAQVLIFCRVSFGSSKGSMVETLVYESPVSEESKKVTKTTGMANVPNGTTKGSQSEDILDASPDAAG